MKKKLIAATIVTIACGVVAGGLMYNRMDGSKPTVTQAAPKATQPETVHQQGEPVAASTTQPETTRESKETYSPSFGSVSVPEELKQNYTVNPRASQVITGNSGTMLLIPDNAFTDKNGNAVKGKVKLELVEGLTHEDIIAMNLGTMSDKGMLETGGMIYVAAKSESGEDLVLAEGKTIEAEIPATQVKPGMQLWQGQENADGSITWVNPETINTGLREVPVETLADSNGIDDSEPIVVNDTTPVVQMIWWDWQNEKAEFVWAQDARDSVFGWRGDSVFIPAFTAKSEVVGNATSNGYDIANFTDPKFEHTNIATAEFRSRLPYIRQACDARVARCYADNPQRALWQSDLAAADTLDKSGCALADLFRQFAKNKDGMVDPKDPHTVVALDAAREKSIEKYSKRVKEQQAAYSSYSFGMNKLGWANVDRLYGSGAPMKFNAHIDGIRADETPTVSLLIPGRGIFLPGYRRPNGDYSFTHGENEQTAAYPRGEVAYILARSGSGDNVHYGVKQVVLGINTIESLEMKDGTEAQLATELGNLPPEKKEDNNAVIDDWNTKAMKNGSGCLCGDNLGASGAMWMAK